MFKKQYSFDERFNESKRVLEKYADRIPIICEKAFNRSDLPSLDKSKYLVPLDYTLGQFMFIIRQRMHLKSEEALYFIIANSFYSSSTMIGVLYDLHKDPDGFLYIMYAKENTFG